MNGLLLINKEKDMTSRDVVNIACRHLKTKKIGHTGTLDPNATGVLVLCIGNALKIVDLITSYNKTYVGEVILGINTDTLDITGNILNRCENTDITKEKIENVLNSFLGKSMQEVPLYSAVKVDGKKLYEYARSNIPVVLPVKEISINSIGLCSEIEYSDVIKFSIMCDVSKGTYIRSLIRDIGVKLNTCACMGDLVRVRQGIYELNDCVTLDDVKEGNYKLISMNDALSCYEKIVVSDELEKKVRNGMVLPRFFSDNICVIMDKNDDVIGIYESYEKDNTMVKPRNIFN